MKMLERKTEIAVSREDAKKLAVVSQGLHKIPAKVTDKTILDVIEKIGLLQLDSVNIIHRSHYIVLFSRLGPYDIQKVDLLQYPQKKLTEQWVHVASLIPTKDLEVISSQHSMRRSETISNRKLKILGRSYKGKLNDVLNILKKNGPLSALSFKDGKSKKKEWWSKKPTRVILDILFRQGHIGVLYRKNFNCYYDILNRIVEINHDRSLSGFYNWVVMKSIEAMGIATVDQISDYYRVKKGSVQEAIGALHKSKNLIMVRVDGWKSPAYTVKRKLIELNKIASGKTVIKHTTFLSPFDNLIWERDRTESLFDFHYRTEMYTPAKSRRFGYYVLPILHDGDLIGRMDPKFDRKSNTLIISNIHIESRITPSHYLTESITQALIELAQFLGASNIRVVNSQLKDLKRLIKLPLIK